MSAAMANARHCDGGDSAGGLQAEVGGVGQNGPKKARRTDPIRLILWRRMVSGVQKELENTYTYTLQ